MASNEIALSDFGDDDDVASSLEDGSNALVPNTPPSQNQLSPHSPTVKVSPSSALSESVEASFETEATAGRGVRRQALKLDLGHAFGRAGNKKACDICGEKGGRMVMCGICGFALHARCKSMLIFPCRETVKDKLSGTGLAFPHSWAQRSTNKTYFCNICRLPLKTKEKGAIKYSCISCGIWAHDKCRPLASNNCRQTRDAPCFHNNPTTDETDTSASAMYAASSSSSSTHHRHGNNSNTPLAPHFLVEGNLSAKRKCGVCGHSCVSKSQLTGYRCRWCGIQFHTACMVKHEKHLEVCDFGDLAPLILRPWVVQGMIGFQEQDNWFRTLIENDSKLSKPHGDEGSSKELLIYEGPNVRGRFKRFHVDTSQRASSLLQIALKSFGVVDQISSTGKSSEFYLEEVVFRIRSKPIDSPHMLRARPATSPLPLSPGLNGKVSLHRIVPPPMSPSAESTDSGGNTVQHYDIQRTKRVKGSQKAGSIVRNQNKLRTLDSLSALFVRSGRQDEMMQTGKGRVEIYAAPGVDTLMPNVSLNVTVTDKVSDVIVAAVTALKIIIPASDLVLEEVTCVDGVCAIKVLQEADPVFRSALKHINSHINIGSMRLRLQKKKSSLLGEQEAEQRQQQDGQLDTPKAKNKQLCQLYVTGMRKYDMGEDDHVQNELDEIFQGFETPEWHMEVVVPTHGVTIISVPDSLAADRVAMTLRNHGKTVTFVPILDIQSIAPGNVPVLVCLNGKSGAGQGKEVFFKLSSFLNPEQVFDITKSGPLMGILMFRNVPEFRILVGGGDGTVGWVLNTLGDARHLLACKQPGVAILPIGTGNDLSRILGWGPGYEGERLEPVVGSVLMAHPQRCDRWDVKFDCADTERQPDDVIMTNYFGIGLDAYIAHGFHEKREAHPEKFTSRLRNKIYYGTLGAGAMVSNPCKNLGKHMKMMGDGQEVDVSGFEGIVVLNISSWGGGVSPWGGKKEKRFTEPSISDGKVEVFGISGMVHMSNLAGHMTHGTRIGQFSRVLFEVDDSTFVQADGEPFRLPPGKVTVSALSYQVNMLFRPPKMRRMSSLGAPKPQKRKSQDHRRTSLDSFEEE